MILETLPDSLYSLPSIEVLLRGKKSSIVYKSLSTSLIDTKMYLSSAAILLVRKGKQVIQNYDGSNLIVNENEIIILPKDLYVVSDFVPKEGAFEAVVLFIDDELINKFLLFYVEGNRAESKDNKIIKINSNNKIVPYLESLRAIYKEKDGSTLVEVKIIEFLLLIAGDSKNNAFISSLLQPIRKRGIKKFMEANYLGSLKISDYASLTGRSVSTFNREFKRLYETTPNKWLINKRLEKSRDLLTRTNLSVTEVSMEVGYENISHFISAYKNKYGMTPNFQKIKIND